ncbi:MAG: dTDP-4-dehydrorhamnose 3,5-epimerase [Pseudomonadota bacterium]
MKLIETTISEVKLIEMDIHRDQRGFFLESYHAQKFEALGIAHHFVQDNHSRSVRGTLRGLHYQLPNAQGKLVRVTRGEVFDVAVDIRVGSPTFGRHFGTILSEENARQMFVPTGFAHGFCTLSDTAEFQYKCTDFYAPDCELGIRWNDPEIAIDWPIQTPLLSTKDQSYSCLSHIPTDRLPRYGR